MNQKSGSTSPFLLPPFYGNSLQFFKARKSSSTKRRLTNFAHFSILLLFLFIFLLIPQPLFRSSSVVFAKESNKNEGFLILEGQKELLKGNEEKEEKEREEKVKNDEKYRKEEEEENEKEEEFFENFVSSQSKFPSPSIAQLSDGATAANRQTKEPPSGDTFVTNCTEPICEGALAPIYCSGPLISSAWYFGVQHQCPGSQLLFEPAKILANFRKIIRGQVIKRGDFMQFCDENFANVDYLKTVNLTDWQPVPATFDQITEPKWRKFAESLHQIWPLLTREFVEDVHARQDFYPVLSVPNRFLVPGGFFKVYFYWDTFWILKGLYFSNLLETAYGVLANFAHVLHHHGFIPNSGNIQLSRRSQPPLFTQMIADYFEVTKNKSFLEEFLPRAEQELQWWHRNRSIIVEVDGRNHSMFQYKAVTDCPRSENFLEDYHLGIQSGQPLFFWSSTASACESGLDFSSRWYRWENGGFGKNVSKKREKNKTKKGNASTKLPSSSASEGMSRVWIATNRVLPVDLNVFMALNYWTLARLYGNILGQQQKAEHFRELAQLLTDSIDQLFFDEQIGAWFDFDLAKRELRKKFYPSNIYPLLLEDAKRRQKFCDKTMDYLQGSGALGFKGGIPSSLERKSNEQWDFPNGWAPQQHLFVESVRRCGANFKTVDGTENGGGEEEAAKIAREVADAFLRTAYNGFFSAKEGKPAQMWEKYDVRFDDGRSGFGGEYPPQSGFGWTNGVVLEFIRTFYTTKNDNNNNTSSSSQLEKTTNDSERRMRRKRKEEEEKNLGEEGKEAKNKR